MYRGSIEDKDERNGRARLNATLSFFFGVFLILAIDIAIKRLSRSENNSHTDVHDASAAIAASRTSHMSRRPSNRSIMSILVHSMKMSKNKNIIILL